MHKRCWIAALFLCAVLGWLGGCGGSQSGSVVKGKVTLDGSPLGNAHVDFFPKDNANLAAHGGTTQEDGTFQIPPPSEHGGRPFEPGKYVVTVTKMVSSQKPGDMSSTNAVPAIYSDRNKTPLVAEVKAGDNQLEPFNLSSKKK